MSLMSNFVARLINFITLSHHTSQQFTASQQAACIFQVISLSICVNILHKTKTL